MKKLSSAAVFSGGAFQITFLAGSAYYLLQKRKFDAFVGTSSGAIVSLICAINRKDLLIALRDEIDFDDIWVRGNPNTFWGYVYLIGRILMGKVYLYNQDGLLDLLKKYISKEEFDKWSSDENLPDCYVGVAYPESNTEDFISLKNITYENAIKAVHASASMPVYVKPVDLINQKTVDGGLLSHAGCEFTSKKLQPKEMITTYSRPNTNLPYYDYPKEGFLKIGNIINFIFRVYDIWVNMVSIYDEFEGDTNAKEYNIKRIKIFTNEKLSSSTYEVTEEEKEAWFQQGFENAKQKVD